MFFHNINSILVIKLRHIGDVLLTYPVFTNLRVSFPHARIYALVNKGTEEMITGHPDIDEILTIDKKDKNFIKRNFFFPIEIRKKNFDLTIDLTSGDRSAIISFLSNAEHRISYDPEKKGIAFKKYFYSHIFKNLHSKHTVTKNLNLLTLAGINSHNIDVFFHIPEKDTFFIDNILRDRGISEKDKLVHIHPTSRWLFKCWDEKNWITLIEYLLLSNFKICVTCSPSGEEINIINNILYKFRRNDKIINLAGKITLKQLGAVSKKAVFFTGVDTAPMHIAAAVKTPVIALFGAGVNQWRPYGDGHFVLYKPHNYSDNPSREEKIKRNLGNISPFDVISIIKENFQ